MKYFMNDQFSTEEYNVQTDDEEITKKIIIINLKNYTKGIKYSFLDKLLNKAIEKSSTHAIFNCPEGLLVEKSWSPK